MIAELSSRCATGVCSTRRATKAQGLLRAVRTRRAPGNNAPCKLSSSQPRPGVMCTKEHPIGFVARPGAAAGPWTAPEGCVDKQGPQEGASDANGHHVLQGLAGGPQPLLAAHFVAERLDLVKHLPHLGHHIFAVVHHYLHPQMKSVMFAGGPYSSTEYCRSCRSEHLSSWERQPVWDTVCKPQGSGPGGADTCSCSGSCLLDGIHDSLQLILEAFEACVQQQWASSICAEGCASGLAAHPCSQTLLETGCNTHSHAASCALLKCDALADQGSLLSKVVLPQPPHSAHG